MAKYKIVLITTDNDYFISEDSFTEAEAIKKQERGFAIVQTETIKTTADIKKIKDADKNAVKAQEKLRKENVNNN